MKPSGATRRQVTGSRESKGTSRGKTTMPLAVRRCMPYAYVVIAVISTMLMRMTILVSVAVMTCWGFFFCKVELIFCRFAAPASAMKASCFPLAAAVRPNRWSTEACCTLEWVPKVLPISMLEIGAFKGKTTTRVAKPLSEYGSMLSKDRTKEPAPADCSGTMAHDSAAWPTPGLRASAPDRPCLGLSV